MSADWCPLFTKYFTDEQILNPSYMLSTYRDGTWCKMCDAPVPRGESSDDHVRRHTRELRDFRRRSKVEAARRRDEALEERRRERRMEREVLGEAEGGVSEARRLKNRVTSARYKLKHPEKHGRESWTGSERKRLQAALDEAVAAVETYEGREVGGG